MLIDALGTMLWLEPPWENAGAPAFEGIPTGRLRGGFEAEIDYYTEHAEEGADPAGLTDLRRRCATVLSRELGREIDVATMMTAIRFRSFEDTVPALRELRRRGLKLVCVSNWDCSLPEVLAGVGLAAHLDGVVNSAVAGARKPDPAIFERALELAGCEPERALHVGDSDADIAGAGAAEITALRIDRQGGGDIASLAEISEHLRR